MGRNGVKIRLFGYYNFIIDSNRVEVVRDRV